MTWDALLCPALPRFALPWTYPQQALSGQSSPPTNFPHSEIRAQRGREGVREV